MSGFRLRLNRLKNIPYASSIQEHLPFERSFELEYLFDGLRYPVIVKPILVNTVVIFLVHFPGGESESMALVYNKASLGYATGVFTPRLNKPEQCREAFLVTCVPRNSTV